MNECNNKIDELNKIEELKNPNLSQIPVFYQGPVRSLVPACKQGARNIQIQYFQNINASLYASSYAV